MGSPVDAGRAHTLAAGHLEAVFLPGRGMLGASLRHAGAELLRRLEDLDAAAAKGSTAGNPLLHPWANRLPGPRYRAAAHDVTLDPASPLLHLDADGLPMHGVPWGRLRWEVTAQGPARLAARLDWSRADLLRVFPFPHRLELVATLRPDGLTVETTLEAGTEGPVPVSFGFHPYLGIPGASRAQWTLRTPAMLRLALDGRGIPTGEEDPFARIDGALGALELDDGFALLDPRSAFSLSGAGRRITVELMEGFPYAQLFAPKGKDFVAFEPMTAPTGALASGRGLRLVEPGGTFWCAFRSASRRSG